MALLVALLGSTLRRDKEGDKWHFWGQPSEGTEKRKAAVRMALPGVDPGKDVRLWHIGKLTPEGTKRYGDLDKQSLLLITKRHHLPMPSRYGT